MSKPSLRGLELEVPKSRVNLLLETNEHFIRKLLNISLKDHEELINRVKEIIKFEHYFVLSFITLEFFDFKLSPFW